MAFTLSMSACAIFITARAIPPVNRVLQQDQSVDEDGFFRHLLSKYWPAAVIGSSLATTLFLGAALYIHSNMEEPGSVTIAAIEKLLDKYHQEEMDVLHTLKKETSDDPAKELANRGVDWNAESFSAALAEPNFENVMLFLKGANPVLSLYQGDIEFCNFVIELTDEHAYQVIDLLKERDVNLDNKLPEYGWAEEHLLFCTILAERADLSRKIAHSGAKASTITRYVLDTDFSERKEEQRVSPSQELIIWQDLIQSKTTVIRAIDALQEEVKSELAEIEQYRSDCLAKAREKAQSKCALSRRTIRVSEYQQKGIDVLRTCSRDKSFDTTDCIDPKDRNATNKCLAKADIQYSNCMDRGDEALKRKYYRSPSSNEIQVCVTEELESVRCTKPRSMFSKDEDTLREYYSYLRDMKIELQRSW